MKTKHTTTAAKLRSLNRRLRQYDKVLSERRQRYIDGIAMAQRAGSRSEESSFRKQLATVSLCMVDFRDLFAEVLRKEKK